MVILSWAEADYPCFLGSSSVSLFDFLFYLFNECLKLVGFQCGMHLPRKLFDLAEVLFNRDCQLVKLSDPLFREFLGSKITFRFPLNNNVAVNGGDWNCLGIPYFNKRY